MTSMLSSYYSVDAVMATHSSINEPIRYKGGSGGILYALVISHESKDAIVIFHKSKDAIS